MYRLVNTFPQSRQKQSFHVTFITILFPQVDGLKRLDCKGQVLAVEIGLIACPNALAAAY